MVESRLPKPLVAGSIPVSRSKVAVSVLFQNTIQITGEIGIKTVNKRGCMRFSERQLSKLRPGSPHTQHYAPRLSLVLDVLSPSPGGGERGDPPEPTDGKEVVEHVRLVSTPGVAETCGSELPTNGSSTM